MNHPITRNGNLDIVKLICAFLVVCIHIPFPGAIGTVIITLGRIAVPVFFMITGFFYRTVEENGREQKQLIKVLKLTIFANVLYFAWGLLVSMLTAGPANYIRQVINSRTIFNFFVLNESPFGIHLWYLGALLFSLIILFFLKKNQKLFRLSFWLIPILLIGDLALGKYSLLLFCREFDLLLVRNFLFVGLPYVLLGVLLSEKVTLLKNIFGKRQWCQQSLLYFSP